MWKILMAVWAQVERALEEKPNTLCLVTLRHPYGGNRRRLPGTLYVVASTCKENECWGGFEQALHKLANWRPKDEVLCRHRQSFSAIRMHIVCMSYNNPRNAIHWCLARHFYHSNERPINILKTPWAVVGGYRRSTGSCNRHPQASYEQGQFEIATAILLCMWV